MLGWSCSKVAIPIADFTLRFFLFVFHRDLRKGEKITAQPSLLKMKIGRSLSYPPFGKTVVPVYIRGQLIIGRFQK